MNIAETVSEYGNFHQVLSSADEVEAAKRQRSSQNFQGLVNTSMQIEPIATQSVQTLQHREGNRTEITERRYQDIGNKIVVQDVHYYIYNSRAEIEPTHKSRVDLRV